jgi:peptidoglycan-N-acetylglucosamine deacetylase
MPGIDRRALLGSIAMAVLAAASAAPAAAEPLRPMGSRPAGAPYGLLTRLPPLGRRVAITVDDGVSTEVVASFIEFCRDTGTRLTFFVNGVNPSWTANAPALRPMVESGQIQLGNHTWSHPYLTRIGERDIADQITRNARFLGDTYGVDGTPYFRPPFGRHTVASDRIATDLGYRTITTWSEQVGDFTPLTERELVDGAAKAFQPGNIVLAHANLPTITRCYARLVDLIAERGLQTVTLDDVFG